MPSGYAHYRFGGQMISRLPEKARFAAQKWRKLYDLGAHGPDLFFFYRPRARTAVGDLGKKYHFGSAKALFTAAARRLRLQPKEEGVAYLYGLLTHYALDSVCHPYVEQVDHSGEAEHTEMETEFDRYLMELDGCLLPKPHYPTDHMRLTRQESLVVAQVFPEATPAQLREAAWSMGFLTRQCMHTPGLSYDLLKKALGSKFSQFLMTPQPNDRCAATNPALLGLYGKAQQRFDRLCQGLHLHLTTGAPLGRDFDLAFDVT